MPRILAAREQPPEDWAYRWNTSFSVFYGAWGSSGSQLNQSNSWVRIARLYLALGNTLAAVDAMQQAIQVSGASGSEIRDACLAIAQQRQLTKEMLPVFRSLIAHFPTNRPVQLAFADSLTANGKRVAAVEVYRRILKRGVSSLEVLNAVRRKLGQLDPDARTNTSQTLADLEAEVRTDPGNVRKLYRLAKAYYYSLQIDKARDVFVKVTKTAPHLAGLDDFSAAGVDVQVSTDDGTAGHHGLVTDLLEEVLAATSGNRRIVCCGPEPMMEAVSTIARQAGVPCQVSLETPMSCGIGICFSCVTKVRTEGDTWDYKRTCVDGPVFDAEQIVW
ncbi:MAG: tetratricopeptide repeat protein [Planctomycetes bacterium]|nr:tetratricopeptide repeat protein [Planctomycetota bacterium]